MATEHDKQPAAGLPEGGVPRQWRGPEELEDSPELRAYLKQEFPDGAEVWDAEDDVSRRQFLTLMGASLALAGVTGCSPRPAPSDEKILPYSRQPEQMTLGVPLYFATAAPLAGYGLGVLVKSQEGRPIKIEGNPSHPASLGSTDVYTQASVLNLYDPDRSQTVTNLGVPRTWEHAMAALRSHLGTDGNLRKDGGAGLRIVTETVTSPSLTRQMHELLRRFPNARWVVYDPVASAGVRQGARQALEGDQEVHTTYDFTKANVILSLDADFLACGPAGVRYSRDFASRRRVRTAHPEDGIKPDQMNRLYVVETMLTPTGGVADHRLALRPSEVEAFARALAAELGVAGAPQAGPLPANAQAWVRPLAADLRKAGKAGLVVAGDGQPASVHALAHAINAALGGVGTTVNYLGGMEARPENAKQAQDLKGLTDDMNAGRVQALFVLGCNPVYNAPADYDFAAAMEKVPLRVHLGEHHDETAVRCQWHINEANYLETWGDIRAYDGTYTIQQPLIAPLYNGRSCLEFVAALINLARPAEEHPSPETGREIVRATWRDRWDAVGKEKRSQGDFEAWWQGCVQDGVVYNPAQPLDRTAKNRLAANAAKVTLRKDWAGKSGPAPKGEGLEISFRPDPGVFDGRFANNGWLQEMPKPITKITWDNAILMSPKTAQDLGVPKAYARWTGGEHGRAEVGVAEIEYQGRKVRGPVWVVPGHADGAITVHLGFGRERAGRVGNAGGQPVGFNAYAIRTADAPSIGGGAKVTRVPGVTLFVACTQMIYSMDNRSPVRRETLAGFLNDPTFAKKRIPAAQSEADLIDQLVPGSNGKSDHGHDHDHDHGRLRGEEPPGNPLEAMEHRAEGEGHGHHDPRMVPLTIYPELERETRARQWGMTIDLSTCTSCHACVIACQSENNIPVVGKLEVTRGREMHWIRIDRYHEGDPNNADTLKTYFQPLPCMHCEKAPCELVCPVMATAHSADGLNDMVYNRCVGTRYCSNNCPYKVRRFNFLTYADWNTESLKLMRNPEVTVRSRGVMEKCTYCVQRIRAAEIEAERERRPVYDGEIVTACQAACPSGAIVFGDINDTHSNRGHGSAVRRWKQEPTNYGLLAELNTQPRTTYLAVVRNPNPEMPKGA